MKAEEVASRWFTSFEQAWQSFLSRDHDLDSFFDPFPESETYSVGWMIPIDATLMPVIRDLQSVLAGLDWIRAVPNHFLHVWVCPVAYLDKRPTDSQIQITANRARLAWRALPPLRLSLLRVGCFNTAVIVEASGPEPLLKRLLEVHYWSGLPFYPATPPMEMRYFLPHLALGLVVDAHAADALRPRLIPVRDTVIGEQSIREVDLCVLPASRGTIGDPWQLAARVRLR